MVRLPNEHVQPFGHADEFLRRTCYKLLAGRYRYLLPLAVLTFSSNHVITMDLHASQIQGLSMSLNLSLSELLMIAGFFNVPVRQDIVSPSCFTLNAKYRLIICTPR